MEQVIRHGGGGGATLAEEGGVIEGAPAPSTKNICNIFTLKQLFLDLI